MNKPESFKEQFTWDSYLEKHTVSKRIAAVLVAVSLVIGSGMELAKKPWVFGGEKYSRSK